MEINNNVIQLAKERALFGFSALVQQVLQDVYDRIQQLTIEGRALDPHTLTLARQFVQASSKEFVKRAEVEFRASLDRAMRTMYTDSRVSIDQLSADNLSLIDDDVVLQQIEVDRLVLRLRDADDDHLRNLTLMIAQLHDDHQVRERENPFRPYVMARSMHQVLHQMVSEEEVSKRLFALISDAMVNRVADFYGSLCQVFESNGIQTQLWSQKFAVRKQHDTSGKTIIPDTTAADINARVMPGLQRMLEMMNQVPAVQAHAGAGPNANPGASVGTGTGTGAAASAGPLAGVDAQAFQHFVNGIFKAEAKPEGVSGHPAAAPAAAGPGSTTASLAFPTLSASSSVPSAESAAPHAASSPAPAGAPGDVAQESTLREISAALLARLNEYQQEAARDKPLNAETPPLPNQLFSLGEQIGPEQTTKLERVAIDVVAMLFELILGDAQIPAGSRNQIGRLHIPFLKSAMLMPDMLQQTEHPARQLINRMGTAAVGLDPATPMGQRVEQEITRIVHNVLETFDDDVSVFSDGLADLEKFLAENLRHSDSNLALSVDAIEEVERSAVQKETMERSGAIQAAEAPVVVPPWLAIFKIDQRVTAFIVNIWMHVLEKEAEQHSSGSGMYRDLLPDLIWSAQEKRNPEERAALVRMLPMLVKLLKDGLSLVNLPPDESKRALDSLVDVHMQIMRTAPDPNGKNVRNLKQMREYFSKIAIGQETAPPPAPPSPSAVESKQLETELAKRGVSVDLDLEREPGPAFASDEEWLTRMQVGTCVERWSDAGYQMARLTWISKRQTLYVFQMEKKNAPVAYSKISLIKSLREGSVRLVEYAPVFERAVDSLLTGAKAVENPRPE